ncbi:MAG: M1 family metallopeptidase [Bacteroidota bacterium]|nr:M1 family metallopeptidase [Bacteroidota bacterium]
MLSLPVRFRTPAICFLYMFSSAFSALAQQSGEIQAYRAAEMRRLERLSKRAAYTIAAALDYDVTYYRLEVSFPGVDSVFRGTVTMTARSATDALTAAAINAGDNLTISAVTMDGVPLAFSHAGDTLTVTLPRPYGRGEFFTLVIAYSSPYAGSAITHRSVPNAALGGTTPSISSQAEPYDARRWWPCKDDPADKADSMDCMFTADSSLFCVGNGILVSDMKRPDGTRTFHWKTRYPIATYLVSMAAARYAYREHAFSHGGTTMPVGNWFYGMTPGQMAPNETAMLQGLQVYSDLFGTYPFMREKYGMAEYEAFGGAMEHQTVSSMGFYGTSVVVHELSHQWFGDKVTCADFGHIWLNEGWATYCEALFAESTGGRQALKSEMAANAYYGPGTIFVYDALNKGMGQIFNGNLSYNKASWVLHMLRHVVGDSTFFRAARKYLGGDTPDRYRSVTTDEFRRFYEEESGMDLETFFRQWIYGEYYPTYRLTWAANASGGDMRVEVHVEQLYTPQRQVFDMPIDLTFRFGGRDSTLVVRNASPDTTYVFHFAEKPESVLLDKDDWILKRVVQPITNPTFDRGILLVNGVDWDVEAYTADLKLAYEDSVFTGGKPYTLWDIFPNPRAGYPGNTPAPSGSGSIPADILGRYCPVVWVGNAYNGDETVWQNSNIWEYLKAGGNVVLLTRYGRSFITTSEMQQFLGVTWTTTEQPLQTISARVPWLADIAITGEQTLVHTFATTLTRQENELLYSDPNGNPAGEVGVGVLAKPIETEGRFTGSMVFLSMRPYRVDRGDLKRAMQAILDRIPCTAVSRASAVPLPDDGLHILASSPHPIDTRRSPDAEILFSVGGVTPQSVMLKIHDLLGRETATLLDQMMPPGLHSVHFDASRFTEGTYLCVLSSVKHRAAKMLLVVR